MTGLTEITRDERAIIIVGVMMWITTMKKLPKPEKYEFDSIQKALLLLDKLETFKPGVTFDDLMKAEPSNVDDYLRA